MIFRDKDRQECNTLDNRKTVQTQICKICTIKEFQHTNSLTSKSSGAFFTKYNLESYYNDSIPTTRERTLDRASTSHACQNKEFYVKLRPPIRGTVIKMGSNPHKVERT